MKQLLQNVETGKSAVVEVPVPSVGSGQALVRTAASLVSAGTERMVIEFAEKNLLDKARARPDLVKQVWEKAKREGILETYEAVRKRLDQPLALGYSSAGTIIAVGSGVTRFKVGDRVACAGGGYASHAEIVRVPVNLLAKIPTGRDGEISFDEAAFATVGAIALHGIRLGRPQLGETVAVIGLGLIGLMAVQLAKAAGCHVVGTDPDAARCKLAKQFGCSAAAESADEFSSAIMDATGDIGADVVLITAATESNGPVELAGKVARDRGVVVAVGAVGTALPRKPYYEKEIDFRISRSYGPGRYDAAYEDEGHDYPIGYVRWTEGRNLQAFLELLAEGKLALTPLISHRFDIEDASYAYDLITGKTGEPFLGVVLQYPGEANLATRVELVSSLDVREQHKHEKEAAAKLGVLGAGNFVTMTLLPVLYRMPGVELQGICSGTGTSARHAGEKFGFEFCATDEDEILRNSGVNTVVVATRHNLHARQVSAALAAGKHVFCEKPLCLNDDELLQILSEYEAARERSLGAAPMLMVGFNRRFAPMARAMKNFFDDTNEPMVMHHRCNAGFIPPGHWTQDPLQGGGRILGEACHFVDFLTFLNGSLPVRVQARALPNQGHYCDDNVAVTLEFTNGSVGTIHYVASGDKSFGKERVEAFAGGRAAVLDDFRRLELARNGRRKVSTSRLRLDKGHRGEWEALVAALQRGEEPPIPLAETVAVTLATFRILDSMQSGQPVLVDWKSGARVAAADDKL